MNHTGQKFLRAFLPVFLVFLLAVPVYAQHGGFGGGGFGGHFGGGSIGGGHFGGTSGGFSGHSLGRALGHAFGFHGRGRAAHPDIDPPLAGAVFLHGRVVQMPNPVASPFGPGGPPPRGFFGIATQPTRAFPEHRFGFFDGFPCGPADFLRRHAFADGDFACFGGGFFLGDFSSDDLFFSRAFGGSARLHEGPAWTFLIGGTASDVLTDEGLADAPGIPPATEPAELRVYAGARSAEAPLSITLLQLSDGSMYGVTDYWVEGEELHYVTDYGARNAIALNRVDLQATAELNAERGVAFQLRLKEAEKP
jgi:hypothetical protein